MTGNDPTHCFSNDLLDLLDKYQDVLDINWLVAPLLSSAVYLMLEESKSTEEAVEGIDQMISHAFKVFEGILPSDKFAQAETLENTLLALMKNPQGLPILTQVLGYDPKKLFTEVLELRGIKHPQRFKIDEVRLMELQQAAQAQQQLENGPPNPAGAGQPLPGAVNPGAVPATPGSFEALIG